MAPFDPHPSWTIGLTAGGRTPPPPMDDRNHPRRPLVDRDATVLRSRGEEPSNATVCVDHRSAFSDDNDKHRCQGPGPQEEEEDSPLTSISATSSAGRLVGWVFVKIFMTRGDLTDTARRREGERMWDPWT